MADIPEETSLFLLPCSICSRTFRPEALERHEKVCETTLSKKRKVFDSFKSRVQGTELQQFLGPTSLPGQPVRAPVKIPVKAPEKKKPAKSWKQTHEALVATLRAARGLEVPATTVPLVTSGTEQCPTCGRHFGPRAFDRHVEFCREQMARKPRTPSKTTPAQERQDARIRYRAPLSIKKSRPDVTLHRLPSNESAAQRPQSLTLPSTLSAPTRTVATAPARRGTSPVKAARTPLSGLSSSASAGQQRSPVAAVASVPGLTRFGSVRGSLRLRGVSPAKLPSTTNPKRPASPEKQDHGPHPPRIKTKLKTKEYYPPTPEPGNSTFSKMSMESMTAAAEQQMRALMSWSSDSELAAQPKPIHPRSAAPALGLPAIRSSPAPASPLQASPTSAFTPVRSPKLPRHSHDNDLWSPSKYCDENDNYGERSGPDLWNTGDYTEGMVTSTPKKPSPAARAPRTPTTVRKAFNHEAPHVQAADDYPRRHSVSSQPSDSTLADEGVLWTNEEQKAIPALNKSRKKTFARSKSVFEDRNRMLFLQTYEPELSSSEEEAVERRRVPLSQPNLPHSLHRPGTPLDDAGRENAMGGGDSAYSSLNRRSPREQNAEAVAPRERKVSKFCHECGSKFPVTKAKFCCECGIRRLLL